MNIDKQHYRQVKKALYHLRCSTFEQARESYLSLNEDQKQTFMLFFKETFNYSESEITRRGFALDLVLDSKLATKHIKTRRLNLYNRAVKAFEKLQQFQLNVINNPQ
jgi:catalase